ncbi:MAG TPA: ATP-binding protein [Planctomycetota bacterium]|nr:ATP-binding protein [Planctomycetota bacterium]
MHASWESLHAGNYEVARRELEEAARTQAPPLDVLHNLAVCCYKLGDFDAAVRTARRALDAFGDSHRTVYLVGLILKEAGKLDEAVEAFSSLIAACPASGRAWYHRGTCHFRRGKLVEATVDLERAVELEPISLAARYNLGVVHVAVQQWERARDDFAACLRLDPAGAEEYAELLVNIGRAQVCRRVYGQGHRLKNMLGIVGDRLKGLLSEVRSRLSAGDREQADEISEQHDLIFADLTAFLSTLEPSPLELDLVDLRDLVDRALFTAGPATAKLAVEKHLAEVPEIVCDPASIHEAFLNILLNASEAMPDGGTLVVTLEQPDDDTVSVSFRDTGVGIEPGALGRIFQFGYSTKVFGSGLGLSQARESVRMHGGTLGVASEPGRGATFTVTLPSSPEIRPTLEDLTLRPVLFEDPQDLLVSFTEDEGLLIL